MNVQFSAGVDTLLYSAVVYESAGALESQRVPHERRIACSYRLALSPDGQLYSSQNGWGDFTEQSDEFCKSGDFSHILLADIADFYNQISVHRVRHLLQQAGAGTERSKNVEHFLLNLNGGNSQGIPVGPTASILLAEACLADVDTMLLRNGHVHTRYVDDFRIFCRSRAAALEVLHDLSDYLYTAHRLPLSADKTTMLEIDDFAEKWLFDPESHEQESRSQKLELVAQRLKDFTGYSISADDIDDETKSTLARENLKELLEVCVQTSPLNLGWARFLLRQARVSKTSVLLETVLNHLETLAPAFRDVCRYLEVCAKGDDALRVGKALFYFLDDSDLGFSPYVRFWALDLAVSRLNTIFEDEILELLGGESGQMPTQRFRALLARELGHVDWIRRYKEVWQNSSPWNRRALVWSSKALAEDERKHWLRRVENAGDILDEVVAKAALA